jgi:uncharacterized protein YkwD
MHRRLIVSVVAAVTALAGGNAAAAQAACANADRTPDSATVSELRAATVCLINAERKQRGLATLRANSGLHLAGEGHAREMVRLRYFSHRSASGGDFRDRILRTGFARGTRALVGENLAWGSQASGTARSMVNFWMGSPGHRANILKPEFREIGVAVVHGSPRGASNSATYAAEFGRRYGTPALVKVH